MDAGAEANAVFSKDGYKGRILATAVKKGASPDIIELLHAKGADFNEAFYLMQSSPDEKWEASVKQSLKAHCKRITGQPLDDAEDLALKQQIAELRDELTRAKKDFTVELSTVRAELDKLKAAQKPKPPGSSF